MFILVALLLIVVGGIYYLVTRTPKTVPEPAPAPAPTPEPIQEEEEEEEKQFELANIPLEFRTSNGLAHRDAAYVNGELNTQRAWAAINNAAGTDWYQLDAGKVTQIGGVAIQGRGDTDQWVQSFKVKYRDEEKRGAWMQVDEGATFVGSSDRDTVNKVLFKTPVTARYIRIYPQTFKTHMSMRVDLLANDVYDFSNLKLLGVPGANRSALTWWKNNDEPYWAPDKGVLDSISGWHPGASWSLPSAWYQFNLDGVIRVSGIAIQGRADKPSSDQRTTEFTVQYKKFTDDATWKTVDNGKLHYGPLLHSATYWAVFDTPIDASIVRIMPKAYTGNITMRADLLGLVNESTTETYVIRGYSAYDD